LVVTINIALDEILMGVYYSFQATSRR
jgi:hypothetical protein